MTREELEAEVERLRENGEACERVMRRENVILRAAERERDKLRSELNAAREENKVLIQTSADPCLACGWRFFVPGDGCQGCLVEQLRKDIKRYVAEERAAVVAHLRERAIHGAGNVMSVDDACTILADLFERGEHRREEKP